MRVFLEPPVSREAEFLAAVGRSSTLHRRRANTPCTLGAYRDLLERCRGPIHDCNLVEGFSPRYLKVGGRWCDHERWALLAEEWRPR